MLLLLHKPKPPISHRAYDEETLVDVELGLDSKSAKKRSIKSSIGAIFGSKRREGAPTYPSHEPKSLPCAEPFNYPKRSTRARSAQAVKRLRARMLKSRRTPAALQRSDSQMTLLDADSALAHKPKASRAGVEGGHSPKLLFKFLALKIPISLRLNPVKRALERLVAQLGRSALGVLIPILKGVGGIVRFFLDLGWGVVKLCFWVAKAVLIGALAQVVFWGCCGSGLALLPLLPVYAIIRAISPWLAGHVKDPVHFILFGPWMLPMALLCWLLGEKFPGEPVNY